MIPGSLYKLYAMASKKSITMHGHSLPQRFIAIVLLSSLLLQSRGEGLHAGTLRMIGSEGEEAMDKNPPEQSRGGHGDLAVPATSSMMPFIPALDQGQAPLVAAIAPPDSTASAPPASLSGTSLGAFVHSSSSSAASLSTTESHNKELDAAVDDRKPSALSQPPDFTEREQAYTRELQSLVSDTPLEETADGRKKMATVLNQLAALHQEQGEQTGELSHYTDAAICYQHALRMWEEESSSYKTQIDEVYKGLAQIRAAMIASMQQAQGKDATSNALTSEALRAAIAGDKKKIEKSRKNFKKKLDGIYKAEKEDNKEEYIKKSRSLFSGIAQSVAALLKRLYEESERELGPAPCRYAVIGLGSMALQQMTPYSDLEFAILMEDGQDPEKLKENRAYLRALTHLVRPLQNSCP
jgi:Putative nucleotidyltransferase DUF294